MPQSKQYHLKITHIKGTVIRGEREGVFDELLRIYAVDLITGQKFDNILMKKSYGQQFCTNLLTIENLMKLSGSQVDCPLKPQLGYVRSLELENPIYVEARLTYIPKNGAYKNKKDELVPYKTTDVYRVDMAIQEDDRFERMSEQYDQWFVEGENLFTEITGMDWNPQTAGAEDDQILMNIIKVYKIIQRTATKQELVQLKNLLNDLIKE
ncbi:MAG: hypothetical protein IJZ09_06595 [Tidjanibacter sp.]|nr:hypothetical protein [Tidjanibacter sp.]